MKSKVYRKPEDDIIQIIHTYTHSHTDDTKRSNRNPHTHTFIKENSGETPVQM